jgi:hypothetical protein
MVGFRIVRVLPNDIPENFLSLLKVIEHEIMVSFPHHGGNLFGDL